MQAKHFYVCSGMHKLGTGGQQYEAMKADVEYQQELKSTFIPGQRPSPVSAYGNSQCPCAVSD